MQQIDLNEAKLHLVDLIDVALGGEEVVITQNDQPVLKLVRIVTSKVRRKAGRCTCTGGARRREWTRSNGRSGPPAWARERFF